MNKKGQTIGLVSGLISGVAFLIIGIVIAFTVVGTLQGADIIPQTRYTVTNESDLNGPLAFVNQTGYSVNGSSYTRPGSFVITAVIGDYNQTLSGSQGNVTNLSTGYNYTLAAANYSINAAGILRNASNYNFGNVSVSYVFVADNTQNIAAGNLTSNFSAGVQNVSSKIPTILLIGAIVLILGTLAVLVGLWQRMRMGGKGSI